MTATQLKNYKAKDKQYTVSDGNGLSIVVTPKGAKYWRFRYRFDGKAKMLSVGTYPDVSLESARKKATAMREMVADAIDPGTERKTAKAEDVAATYATEFTFEKLTREILKRRLKKGEITEVHYNRTLNALVNDAYPIMGDVAVKDVKPSHIKKVVKHVLSRGADESARKLFYAIGKLFKTIISDNDEDDPLYNYEIEISPALSISIADLAGEKKVKNYPTFTAAKDIKGLLDSIETYSGDHSTRMAMKLLPHVFLRSYNIRYLEWSEVDFEDKLIRIDGAKMKTKNDFIIPMSEQVVALLKEMYPFSGTRQYVFPSVRNPNSPMSDNTMISALRRMGYTKEQFVPHSWRSVFSTIANEKTEEHNKQFEVIETALAHSVGSSTSRAYNRAAYLEQRKELYQWWSDWLEAL